MVHDHVQVCLLLAGAGEPVAALCGAQHFTPHEVLLHRRNQSNGRLRPVNSLLQLLPLLRSLALLQCSHYHVVNGNEVLQLKQDSHNRRIAGPANR